MICTHSAFQTPLYRGIQTSLYTVISHKVFVKSFCSSQLPHKSVNSSFTITHIENNLTDLCGNWLLQNDLKNTLCGIYRDIHARFVKAPPLEHERNQVALSALGETTGYGPSSWLRALLQVRQQVTSSAPGRSAETLNPKRCAQTAWVWGSGWRVGRLGCRGVVPRRARI